MKTSWKQSLSLQSRGGHYRRRMRWDNCVLSILNNKRFRNKYFVSLTKYRSAWTNCSQHSNYHQSPQPSPTWCIACDIPAQYFRCLKAKNTPGQALISRVWIEVLVYSLFNLGTEYWWIAKANHQLLLPGKTPASIIQGVWWAPHPVSSSW